MRTQNIIRKLSIVAAIALAVGTFGVTSAKACTTCGCTPAEASSGDIQQVAAQAGQFNTLLAAAKAAGLVEALQGAGPLTVFAPTDEAFSKLPAGTVEMLLSPENKSKLAAVLKYHVVAGKLEAQQVVATKAIDTLNGQRLNVVTNENGVTIDNAKVVKTDVAASNGVIHFIDSVMLPTDKDIVDIAAGNQQFSTLVAAVKAAGLVEALKGDGPLTVFAPTDEAFAKLPKGTVENLLKPENKDQLVALLTYHVVAGRVFSDAAAKGATVKTLQGATLTTKSAGGEVLVNDAKVIGADIDASNGVIHVIDSVLLPPSAERAAAQMIEQAIAKGAPAFNRGHVAECVHVYSRTLMALASHEAIEPQLRSAIRHMHARGEATDGHAARAWLYRDALDMVCGALNGGPTMEMAATR